LDLKKAFLPALFFLLVLAAAPAQPLEAGEPPSIAGHWEGTISVSGVELGVLIDFSEKEDKTWTGDIDIPLQGAKDLPLVDITVEGYDVTFDIKDVPGNPSFDGKLSEDGFTLSGDFTQNDQSYPFALKRKTEAQAEATPKTPKDALQGFDELVNSLLEEWKVPGAAIAVVKDDQVIFSKGFGYRDLKSRLPVTPNTLFAIGSATKAFTTTLLGILVDEGKLDWKEPVRTYIPSFGLKDEEVSRRMTPRDLVTHRSGLPRHDLLWYSGQFTRKELFERLKYLEANEDFRTTFQYQNLMFMAAGYLAEQVTGSTWEELVRKKIFEPLGMRSTTVSVEDSKRTSDFALPYEEETKPPAPANVSGKEPEKEVKAPARTKDIRKKGRTVKGKRAAEAEEKPARAETPSRGEPQIKEMKFRNIDAVGPAGSINSNLTDMVRWLRFNLNGGRLGENAIISKAGLEEIHSPAVIVRGGMIYQLLVFKEMPYLMYGLGWFIQPYRGHRFIHHGGNIDGFSAMVSFMPDDKIGVVVLTNLNGTPLPYVLTLDLVDRLLGFDETDWNSRFKLQWMQVKGALEKTGETEAEYLRKKSTNPAHPLAEYAGVYENKGYGLLRIALEGNGFKAVYKDLSSRLEHWHYEIFRASEEPLKGMKFTFLTNLRGDIDRVSAALEPAVSEIVFTMKPPESMRNPEFLKQFAGKYDLVGIPVTVALKGDNVLTVTSPGESPQELVPYRGTEFNLKGAEEAGIRFIVENNKVVKALFIQPTLVLEGRRVE
jgi:CubicO group peptidase (beta-lactamase class C family)